MNHALRRALLLLSFPGIVAHEFAHVLACWLTRTRIFEICWFRLGDPAGYVVHARAASTFAGAMIGLMPFAFNTLAGAALAFSPATALLSGKTPGWPQLAMLWLGLSLALHAFPSPQDAQGMWAAAKASRFSLLKRAMVLPAYAAVHLLSFGSRFWLDVVYGLAVGFGPAALALFQAGRLRLPF